MFRDARDGDTSAVEERCRSGTDIRYEINNVRVAAVAGLYVALHEFGGLRMGTDPASSVTDPDGRFWRVPNLSCADAAIWPHQGSANSYLTITAIALRNATRLAAELSPT